MATKVGTILRTVSIHRNAQQSKKWNGFMAVMDPGTTEMDPFIFLVHHVHKFAPKERTGFPPHPHRGFETVTYAIEGGFDHGDSRGNRGSYRDGDVQWMTAGSGVLHSEMFLTDPEKPSNFNGFQLWLNLPSKLKMSEPNYLMLWNKDIPTTELTSDKPNKPFDKEDAYGPSINSAVEKGKVWAKIISGRVNEIKANVEKSTPVAFLHVKLEPNTKWFHHIPKEHHALFYLIGGSIDVTGRNIGQNQYCMLKEDGDYVEIQNGDKAADFLLLYGKPFKEPVAHHGPFVMNTQEEIMQAFKDLQLGKFGDMYDDY